MDSEKSHRSHIGSRRASTRGWTKIPPPEVRAETRRQGVQPRMIESGCPYCGADIMIGYKHSPKLAKCTGCHRYFDWDGKQHPEMKGEKPK